MAKTALATLNAYFNEGDGVSLPHTRDGVDHMGGVPAKRPTRDFAAEIRALSMDEKNALAQGVSDITGEPFTLAVK